MSYVQKKNRDEVGQRVCLGGVTTDGICGYIKDTDYTANISDGGDIITLFHQRKATFIAEPGDSGGPVYTGYTMKGIQSAGNLSTFSTYSHIGYLTEYFPNKRVMRIGSSLAGNAGIDPFTTIDISQDLERVDD